MAVNKYAKPILPVIVLLGTLLNPSLATAFSTPVIYDETGISAPVSADLSVEVTGNLILGAGNEFTYTIKVKNNGPSSASGVVISSTIPSGSTFKSAQGGGTHLSGTVTFIIGSLENGVEVSRSVIVAVTPGQPYTISATVSGSTTDLVSGNNSDSKPVTPNVLPVTLSRFTAKKGDGAFALLDWTTEAELNSSKFDVEHSTNGKNWNLIGTVAAKGESIQSEKYQYLHASPVNGENLYRLKLVDRDGTFAYSRITTVDFSIVFGASVYPNPSSDKIKLNLAGVAAANVAAVRVTGSDGKVIFNQTALGNDEINVSNLVAGAYVVGITLKNGVTQNVKIVVSK